MGPVPRSTVGVCSGSVTRQSLCTSAFLGAAADRHRATSGWRNRTRAPNSTRPPLGRRCRRIGADPDRAAARHKQRRIATGSAAASSSRRRVCPGRASDASPEALFDRAGQRHCAWRPNPPASSAALNPRGNSSNASGLPLRLRDDLDRAPAHRYGPVSAASSSARASRSRRPWTLVPGDQSRSRAEARTAKTNPTVPPANVVQRRPGFARRRDRATGRHRLSTPAVALGDVGQQVKTATPIESRSRGGPELMREGDLQGVSVASPANAAGYPASVRTTRCDAATVAPSPTARPAARPHGVDACPANAAERGLAHAWFAVRHSARLSPARTASRSSSSVPHSA